LIGDQEVVQNYENFRPLPVVEDRKESDVARGHAAGDEVLDLQARKAGGTKSNDCDLRELPELGAEEGQWGDAAGTQDPFYDDKGLAESGKWDVRTRCHAAAQLEDKLLVLGDRQFNEARRGLAGLVVVGGYVQEMSYELGKGIVVHEWRPLSAISRSGRLDPNAAHFVPCDALTTRIGDSAMLLVT
jgi:hypothetical protein